MTQPGDANSNLTTCPAGCGVDLNPMARWAPYRTCPDCGTGAWTPPSQAHYWGPSQPSPEQHAFWSGRDPQRRATIGPGPGRLLDIGCAFGHFVRWALENGWDAWGAERDSRARDATVVPGRVVSDASELGELFDVITLWDVLEHTTHPIELAAGLRPCLRRGGRLFVCSPNFAAMKLRWPVLRHSPRRFNDLVNPLEHPIQFTSLGIRRTLERAGYERVEFLQPPLATRPDPALDALARLVPSLRKGLFVNAYLANGPA